MKHKIITICIFLFSLLVLFVGCTSDNKTDVINDKNSVNIYISANGDLLYCKGNITDKGVFTENTLSLGIRKKGEIISEIEEDGDGNIYCTISSLSGGRIGDKIYVANKDKIKSTVQLDKQFGPNKIINVGNKMYVASAVKPAIVDKNGVTYLGINKNEQIVDKFNLKGVLTSSAVHKGYTYMTICEAEKVGFLGISNSYMVRVNNKTKEIKILNDKLKAKTPRSMAISTDGKIYLVDTPMYSKNKKVSILYKYDLEGNELAAYELDNWADKIAIRDNGIAYITHRGKEEIYDDLGEVLTIFDTKKERKVEKIKVGKGPSNIFIYEKYLLVSNYTDSTISVINMDTNDSIGQINIDNKYKIDETILTKK